MIGQAEALVMVSVCVSMKVGGLNGHVCISKYVLIDDISQTGVKRRSCEVMRTVLFRAVVWSLVCVTVMTTGVIGDACMPYNSCRAILS